MFNLFPLKSIPTLVILIGSIYCNRNSSQNTISTSVNSNTLQQKYFLHHTKGNIIEIAKSTLENNHLDPNDFRFIVSSPDIYNIAKTKEWTICIIRKPRNNYWIEYIIRVDDYYSVAKFEAQSECQQWPLNRFPKPIGIASINANFTSNTCYKFNSIAFFNQPNYTTSPIAFFDDIIIPELEEFEEDKDGFVIYDKSSEWYQVAVRHKDGWKKRWIPSKYVNSFYPIEKLVVNNSQCHITANWNGEFLQNPNISSTQLSLCQCLQDFEINPSPSRAVRIKPLSVMTIENTKWCFINIYDCRVPDDQAYQVVQNGWIRLYDKYGQRNIGIWTSD